MRIAFVLDDEVHEQAKIKVRERLGMRELSARHSLPLHGVGLMQCAHEMRRVVRIDL